MGAVQIWVTILHIGYSLAGSLVVIGIVFLIRSSFLEVGEEKGRVSFYALMPIGAAAVAFGCTLLLCDFGSPRAELTGEIYRLQQSHGSRGGSSFSFYVVNDTDTVPVHAHGEWSAAEDGYRVRVKYIAYSGEIVEIQNLGGMVEFASGPIGLLGLWFCILGAVTCFSAYWGWKRNPTGEPRPRWGLG